MVEAVDMPPAVVLIRNRGRFVVELRNGKNDTFTASFTSAPPSESAFAAQITKFGCSVAEGLQEEQKKKFLPYFVRLLTDALQHSHGTLLAAHTPPENGIAPETLSDGVWLATPIDLASAHAAAVAANDAQGLAALQSFEALFEGMVNSDGVVIFGTNGTILGYRVFLKPTDDEKKNLPDSGGGRRRTFELMHSRIGATLKAAFFRSQDGQTECESSLV
jgi:hypothetical protein